MGRCYRRVQFLKRPLCGAVLGVLCFAILIVLDSDELMRGVSTIASATATIWSAMLGFVLAAEAVLIGFWQNESFHLVRENKRTSDEIWEVFGSSVMVLGLGAIVGFLSLLPWPKQYSVYLLFVNLAFAGLGSGMVWWCISVLSASIRLISAGRDKPKVAARPECTCACFAPSEGESAGQE